MTTTRTTAEEYPKTGIGRRDCPERRHTSGREVQGQRKNMEIPKWLLESKHNSDTNANEGEFREVKSAASSGSLSP